MTDFLLDLSFTLHSFALHLTNKNNALLASFLWLKGLRYFYGN